MKSRGVKVLPLLKLRLKVFMNRSQVGGKLLG